MYPAGDITSTFQSQDEASVSLESRGEEWEVKVLQDVLKHFQADYEAQNRAIEERKKIDKRMRCVSLV